MLNEGALALGARVAARLAGFSGFLHANGFAVGCAEALDTLAVAQRLGVTTPALLRDGLRALLCGRPDEWRRFDALFDAWFLPPNRWQRPQPRTVDAGMQDAPAQDGRGSGEAPQHDEALRPRRAASAQEALNSADFRTLTERAHTVAIEQAMRQFARQLKRLRRRRQVRARRARRLDLPATIRRSVQTGGVPLWPAYRQRQRVRPRLVLLIDVSRSMALYSFFYLRLARALAGELTDVHSFIFHTRLTAVSDALADPDPWRAQERLHLLAQGWGGGTLIGDSLMHFERAYAARLVHGRTALLIFSDGYDTGEPGRLAEALARLRRRARRIVWFNPLAARADYAPLAQGMQAALPHLDLLAPAADLAALRAALPAVLEALQ
ncbi:MAG: VWA domain-containing protein [Burkholderiaceae bacterium]|nr:VWA domain-containing protein [Burkholderiaceae bacterium]